MNQEPGDLVAAYLGLQGFEVVAVVHEPHPRRGRVKVVRVERRAGQHECPECAVGSNIQARESFFKFACRLPVQCADALPVVGPVPVEAAAWSADVRLKAEIAEGVESVPPIEVEQDEPTQAARDHPPGVRPMLLRPLVELLDTWDHRLVMLPGEERSFFAPHRNARLNPARQPR